MSRNQLDQATSPYLLQHKDNPVHWYPWGPEALRESATSGKPILLSIGYTACHWCHVMNDESFNDPETAALMNDLFINVLVDREERPDVDQIYQAAAPNMGGQGGWPLTMFLTQTGAPYFTGGYIPKESQNPEMPSFKTVLSDSARFYREQPEPIASATNRVIEQLNALWNRDTSGPLDSASIDAVAMRVAQRFDIFFGGMTGTPKFPSPPLVELLWRAFLRSGAPQFIQLMSNTLDHILLGGLYDHIGGGFFRYAADERWLTPSFEKMTTDSAQLIDLMVSVWQNNRNVICQLRTEETVEWLLRDMSVEDGFASSAATNVNDVPGKFFSWSEAEIDAALQGTFTQKFKAAYSVVHDGAFEGRNILQRMGSSAPFPQSEADEALLARQRQLLLKARQARPPLARDDKILADANGMVIAALANAGAAMKRKDWTAAAIKTFDFIVKSHGHEDRLAHSWRDGKRSHLGFSDDYAHMARAGLTLWEVTGETRFLEQAKRWVYTLNEYHWDEAFAGYNFGAKDGERLLVRTRSIFDQTQPAANSIMLGVLARLHMITADVAYSQRANQMALGFAGEAIRAYASSGTFFTNLETLSNNLQIVVVGPPNHVKTHELIDAVWGRSLPNKLLIVVPSSDALPQGHPVQGKGLDNGQPTAYVCQRQVCSAPISNPVALSQMLQLPQQRPAPGSRPQ